MVKRRTKSNNWKAEPNNEYFAHPCNVGISDSPEFKITVSCGDFVPVRTEKAKPQLVSSCCIVGAGILSRGPRCECPSKDYPHVAHVFLLFSASLTTLAFTTVQNTTANLNNHNFCPVQHCPDFCQQTFAEREETKKTKKATDVENENFKKCTERQCYADGLCASDAHEPPKT